MKKLLLLQFLFSALTINAIEIAANIPANLLTKHGNNCPSFVKKDLSREAYLLQTNVGKKTLYILGCENYAYNNESRAYIIESYDDSEYIVDVAVSEVEGKKIYATTSLMGASYDDKKNLLYTSALDSGEGDSGQSATYQYDVKSGKFLLVE